MDSWIVCWPYVWMDGRLGERIDGWMEGWRVGGMDGWMDGAREGWKQRNYNKKM